MKQIVIVLLVTLFLSSCFGKNEETVQEDIKQDFFIETKKGSEFISGPSFEKVGRISSQSDISLSAQASGRVDSLLVKVGDTITAGQPLVRLSDSIGNYGINLQRASLSVERARISYDSSKISLDKQVEDTRISMEQAQRNLEAFRKDRENNLILSEDALQNAEIGNDTSRATLQIEQLKNNLEKAKIDFDIKIAADEEQIKSFGSSIKKEFNAHIILLTDIVQFSDEILGVSEINKDINDNFEDFLGAKDKSQRRETEILLQELIDIKNGNELQKYEAMVTRDLSEEEILEIIDFTDGVYDKAKVLLNELEDTLNSSLRSVGALGDAELTAFNTELNGYQASLQGNYSAFIGFASSVESFLRTYKDNQESLARALELQEQDMNIQIKSLLSAELNAEIGLDRTQVNSTDSLQNLEDALTLATNTYNNALKNRDVSLRNLQNAISDAQVGYASALKEYKKLTITAPVSGRVTSLGVDVGQEISPGMNILTLSGDGASVVEVAFSRSERNFVSTGQEVELQLDEKTLTGKIFSLSDVADQNFNYVAEVIPDVSLDADTGKLIQVIVPGGDEIMLVPLNILKPQGDGIALATVYNGTDFESVRLRLGESYDDHIEIVSCAKECEDLNIVLSDISNYDENIFTVVEK